MMAYAYHSILSTEEMVIRDLQFSIMKVRARTHTCRRACSFYLQASFCLQASGLSLAVMPTVTSASTVIVPHLLAIRRHDVAFLRHGWALPDTRNHPNSTETKPINCKITTATGGQTSPHPHAEHQPGVVAVPRCVCCQRRELDVTAFGWGMYDPPIFIPLVNLAGSFSHARRGKARLPCLSLPSVPKSVRECVGEWKNTIKCYEAELIEYDVGQMRWSNHPRPPSHVGDHGKSQLDPAFSSCCKCAHTHAQISNPMVANSFTVANSLPVSIPGALRQFHRPLVFNHGLCAPT